MGVLGQPAWEQLDRHQNQDSWLQLTPAVVLLWREAEGMRGPPQKAGSGQPWAGWMTVEELQPPLPDKGALGPAGGGEVGPRGWGGGWAHLCADGAAALVGAGVDVQVEEDAGFSHLQVGVGIHSSFQPLEAPKHHKSVPAAHRRGSLTAHHSPLNATPRALSPPIHCRGPVCSAVSPPVQSPALCPAPWLDPPEVGKLGGGHI